MFSKFCLLGSFLFLLYGCGGPLGSGSGAEWGNEWSAGETAEPAPMFDNPLDDPGAEYGTVPADTELKTVAVLLPLSGANGNLGTGIQHAIEIAFFQKQPKNIMISFHDVAGKDEDKRRVIDMVLSTNPNLIIGPLFADDAEILKSMKPKDIPAITFTSAKQALGDGIFTLALLPNQAVESIMKEISAEKKDKLLVLAPDSPSGYMLANNAIDTAEMNGVEIAGLYIYPENDSKELKNLANEVSFYEARSENLAAAKGILSDALITQKLSTAEKETLKTELEELNKRDSLGPVPFDSVLFLGNAADSKTLGAYLRYYDVSTETAFYGTALWDTDIAYKDISLAGGEYAGLPRISDSFSKLYSEIEGVKPNRFNTIGFDAAMLAIKALSGNKPAGAYLLDPSGYNGLDGLVRLRPNGENERALQIMQLNGVSVPAVKKRAESNFMKPIYQSKEYDLSAPGEKTLSNPGYEPMDFINIPEHLKPLYDGTPPAAETAPLLAEEPIDVETAEGEVVVDEGFKPVKNATVDKKLIDEAKFTN